MTQREQFEAWAKSNVDDCNLKRDPLREENYYYPEEDIAWQAWQAAQQQSELDRSVASPDEP